MAATLRPMLTQLTTLTASGGRGSPRVDQLVTLAAFAPPSAAQTRLSHDQALIAYAAAEGNVTAKSSQLEMLVAYGTGIPITKTANSWTFVLDGHRIWVLSLGPEGDWAYDKDTKQWCQLQTQGFDGLNFTQGVMWGLRIMGGDVLFSTLYEFDADQPADEGWRPIQHVVTGGIQTRAPNMIGVANFRLTASVGNLSEDSTDVSLTFSDDNGHTWVGPFTITLEQGQTSVPLVWSALGAFAAPGRIFKISDEGGMLSIYGADVALNNYDEDAANGNGG